MLVFAEGGTQLFSKIFKLYFLEIPNDSPISYLTTLL
jgi:hypothetical protein